MNIKELKEKVEVQGTQILHLQEVIDIEQAEILASTEALRKQNDEQKALILELQAMLETGGGTPEEMQAISDKLDANAAAIEAAIADIESTVTPETPVEEEPVENEPPVEEPTTTVIINGERITRNAAGDIISREPVDNNNDGSGFTPA